MSYNYLLDLYKVLEERKSHLINTSDSSEKQEKDIQHLRGQLSAIDDFTTFLRQNYHYKLPRRLR